MPQNVRCTVSNCRYWGTGDNCQAQRIEVAVAGGPNARGDAGRLAPAAGAADRAVDRGRGARAAVGTDDRGKGGRVGDRRDRLDAGQAAGDQAATSYQTCCVTFKPR